MNTNTTLHTVLGASGSVGRAVVDELLRRGLPVRAVSRSMEKPGVATVPADLLQPAEAQQAIAGSSHVYLCVGLPYFSRVWKRDWPALMQNVVTACTASGARLIFLDNIYMYGPAPLRAPFDESHPRQPQSRKGLARKETLSVLKKAMEAGEVEALVGRSADFYGPYATNSMLYVSILDRMLQGKAPQALFPTDIPHTYSDTIDIGRALVALALTEEAYGQEWHLPVNRPITLQEAADMFNEILGTQLPIRRLPDWLQRLLSIFLPALGEVREMKYQFEYPYIMSDQKFRQQFPGFPTTEYKEGLERMVRHFRAG